MNSKIKEYKMNQYNLLNGNFANGSPILFSKKLKKYSKIMTHSSDKSTLNTISNFSTENNNNNGNSYTDEKLNDNIENIGKKINIAFEALEKLILNDKENIKEENNNSFHEEDKTNLKSKKKNHTIAIPKLNFSDIFDNYQNTPVYIKKIKIRKKNDKHNDDTHKKHHHHHKHYSHGIIKPFNIECK